MDEQPVSMANVQTINSADKEEGSTASTWEESKGNTAVDERLKAETA